MHTKTPVLLFVLSITAVFFLATCRPIAQLTETDCTKPEVLCVGLVTALDGVNDNSSNRLAWDGLQKAQAEKVVDFVRYVETVDSKDYYQNITSLAAAGYDIVVTVGEQNAEATNLAADNFPGIFFMGVDQEQAKVRPNLAGLIFHNDQLGFLAGALAAQMTKTGTIAGIFSTDRLPSIIAYKEGYEAGARYINPSINIISIYHPGDPDTAITDAGWGSTTALQAIENGTDVVFSAEGKVSNGALLEAAKNGLYCIGVHNDQWETFPEFHPCLLSSAVGQVTQGVFDILKLVRDEKFPSGNYFGAPSLAPYHDFDTVIPQAIKDKITAIATGLANNSIMTGVAAP